MWAGWCFEERCAQTQTRSWESRTGAVLTLIDGSVSLHLRACCFERRWVHVPPWKEKQLSPSTYPSRGQGPTRMSVVFWFSCSEHSTRKGLRCFFREKDLSNLTHVSLRVSEEITSHIMLWFAKFPIKRLRSNIRFENELKYLSNKMFACMFFRHKYSTSSNNRVLLINKQKHCYTIVWLGEFWQQSHELSWKANIKITEQNIKRLSFQVSISNKWQTGSFPFTMDMEFLIICVSVNFGSALDFGCVEMFYFCG